MSGRILIIDTVATNRIVLKVKLLSAQYDVAAVANQTQALATLRHQLPDLILMDLSDRSEDRHAFCKELRETSGLEDVPILGMGTADTSRARFAALDAGANDILPHPVNEQLLLARVRSLLRIRNARSEMVARDGTGHALGFDEKSEVFAGPVHVTILTNDAKQSAALIARLNQAHPAGVDVRSIDGHQAFGPKSAAPDLLIIDTTTMKNPRNTLSRLTADLRSRQETRLAAQLVIVDCDKVATIALDLGVDDVASEQVLTDELTLRCRALLHRKEKDDRMRDTVKDGLLAAVTDPLTGLYNRRYAQPYLTGMAENAGKTGEEFAIMMIDIDHFKAVNDTYGHAAGDAVLIALAQRLRENLRTIDLIARVGGEEFLIALPQTSAEQAEVAADRLRTIVNRKPFVLGADLPPLPVTVSIGVAVGGADSAEIICTDDICLLADNALYAAKSAGRNTVSLARAAA